MKIVKSKTVIKSATDSSDDVVKQSDGDLYRKKDIDTTTEIRKEVGVKVEKDRLQMSPVEEDKGVYVKKNPPTSKGESVFASK